MSPVSIRVKTFIRIKLEFSCTVWHGSLSKNNVTDIERVQKSAVKLIFRDKYNDYKSALKLLNLESLFERRRRLCLRFAKKCLKMDKFKKLVLRFLTIYNTCMFF